MFFRKPVDKSIIGLSERIVFFPTCAVQRDGGWDASIHGWIFAASEQLPVSSLGEGGAVTAESVRGHSATTTLRHRAFLAVLGGVLKDSDATPVERMTHKAMLQKRIDPFLAVNFADRPITIQLANKTEKKFTLPCLSGRNGHFATTIRLTKEDVEENGAAGVVDFTAVTGLKNDDRTFAGSVSLLPRTGISVISDIDDTVKISNVLDKRKLLRNTFLKDFRAAPGMAAVYNRWKTERNATFHYVSSSPWQLFSPLAAFLPEAGFPAVNSMHLKTVRLRDKTIMNLFEDPVFYKLTHIYTLIEAHPKRRYILVGDTGERDPEIYGEVCRTHPTKIEAVYLREVLGDLPPSKENQYAFLTDPDRYDKAFEGVPLTIKWTVFTDPAKDIRK